MVAEQELLASGPAAPRLSLLTGQFFERAEPHSHFFHLDSGEWPYIYTGYSYHRTFYQLQMMFEEFC